MIENVNNFRKGAMLMIRSAQARIAGFVILAVAWPLLTALLMPNSESLQALGQGNEIDKEYTLISIAVMVATTCLIFGGALCMQAAGAGLIAESLDDEDARQARLIRLGSLLNLARYAAFVIIYIMIFRLLSNKETFTMETLKESLPLAALVALLLFTGFAGGVITAFAMAKMSARPFMQASSGSQLLVAGYIIAVATQFTGYLMYLQPVAAALLWIGWRRTVKCLPE